MNNGFWRRFRRNKGALAGLAVMAVVLLLALSAPLVAPHDPWAMVQRPFLPPLDLAGLPFGTDTMGRDIGSGLAYGARISADRAGLNAGGPADRRVGRRAGRLLRRLDRQQPDALHRVVPGHSQLRAGHRAGGDLPALGGVHRHGHRAGLVAAGGAAGAQRIPDAAPPRLSSMPRTWRANRTCASSSPRSCPTRPRPSW